MAGKMGLVEWKLIAELMKDSRKSDRALSKKVNVSQPTVSRIRHKLEKEGYIKQYTITPDFRKLGYTVAAITFVRYKGGLHTKQADELRKRAEQGFADPSFASNVILFERGLGFGYTGILVSFHEDYSSFTKFLNSMRQYPVLDQDIKTFLVDLNDEVHYRSLTFVPLSQDLLERRKKESETPV
jgi:DNA-binding Lrp family transcriptional regulator